MAGAAGLSPHCHLSRCEGLGAEAPKIKSTLCQKGKAERLQGLTAVQGTDPRQGAGNAGDIGKDREVGVLWDPPAPCRQPLPKLQ